MAENHTKGDGEQTTGDIPVVAPVNMGKSLKFDGKQYNVQVGQTLQVTDSGLVQVKLSSDNGNLLEARKDGLYYGVEAPVDTSNLYVSSSMGNDSNAGTRAAPIKTIAEAMRRNAKNQKFTIHLYENDTHEWRSSTNFYERLFEMRPYGETTDYVLSETPFTSAQHWRSAEIKRPKLVIVIDRIVNNQYKTVEVISKFPKELVTFNSIVFSMRDDTNSNLPLFDTRPFGNADSDPNLWFRGCEFISSEITEFIRVGSRTAGIIFDHCSVSGDNKIIHLEEQGMLSLGFRSSSVKAGTKVNGNKRDGTPTTLTFRGSSSKEDFIKATNKANSLITGQIIT